jgi:hypothetical protein
MSDLSELDALITKLRRSKQWIESAAPAAAEAVSAELKATASAGTTPDGTPWAPRKKDGGKPLAGAAGAIESRAVGSVILTRITDKVHALHNVGNAAGRVRREIIPRAMPARIAAAIRKSLLASWEAAKR